MKTTQATEHFVYMLRCADGTLYSGYTTNTDRRIAEHNSGSGAKYTRARLPVELVYCERAETKSQALKREAELKKLTRAEKMLLIEQSEVSTELK